MFIIRDAQMKDIDGLYELSAHLDSFNLPHDKAVLSQRIQHSIDSWSGKVQEDYDRIAAFVMEDLETRRIAGVSMIFFQAGTWERPNHYFDVIIDERYSSSIDQHFKHTVLVLSRTFDGPTEIGSLVLDPALRGHKGRLGKQLSYVRFLFVAMHREWFRDTMLAELMPVLEPDGRSLLWESLGRRFVGLDYKEADRISRDNKEFIRSLFPQGMIYASLLQEGAQAIIGKVGPGAAGAKAMLESIGFQYAWRIDPFDGGPHFEAITDQIMPVREARHYQYGGTTRNFDYEGLVAVEPREGEDRFRCVSAPFTIKGRKLYIQDDAAAVLGVNPDDNVSTCPVSTRGYRIRGLPGGMDD
ncbi:MAG: Arginine N-succinyltransferase [Myxococcota bacterium]|nr:Arginine N-succinyltransferase [Myxococcota bacterium]